MDLVYEEMIVKHLFMKRVQDRILFELSSPEKRLKAHDRLTDYSLVIRSQYLIRIPKSNSEYQDILDLLKKYGAGESCYAISHNYEIDGKYLPLTEGLKHAVGYGMPSLISCIPDRLAYLECEQSYGPPDRFIIYRPDTI